MMSGSGTRITAGGSGRRLVTLGIIAGLLALLLNGCSRGSYPLDFFYLMHYTQVQRAQEPERRLPPVDSIPRRGEEVQRAQAAYQDLENPLEPSTADLEAGAELFRVNCSMCHGEQGKGDGRVSDFLTQNNYAPAPDLTTQATTQRTDGQIYGIITEGIFVMPAFKDLLTPTERWQVVSYLRTLQEQ